MIVESKTLTVIIMQPIPVKNHVIPRLLAGIISRIYKCLSEWCITLQITVLGDALPAGNTAWSSKKLDRKYEAKITARPPNTVHLAC